MRYHRGEIVHALTARIQGGVSHHTAIVVGDPYSVSSDLYILAQVTSEDCHEKTDFQVPRDHDEFAQAGMANSFIVRCHKLFTVHQRQIVQKIGKVGPNTLAGVDQRIRLALGLAS